MEIAVGKSTVLRIEDRGEFGWQITEGWRNRDGDFKPSWCTRKTGKEQIEKVVPVSVKIGDKAKSIEVLTAILKEITGADYSPAGQTEDVPF